MKRWLRLAWQVFSLALFALVLVLGGPQAWQQIRTGAREFIVIACLFFGIASAVSAIRLQTVARATTRRRLASFREFYHLNIVARALGLMVPRSVSTVGGKSVALRAMDVSFKRAVWIVLLDNAFDLGLLGMLALPALLFLRDQGPTWVFVAMASGLILVLGGVLWWLTSSGQLDSLVRRLAGTPRVASLLRIEADSLTNLSLPPSSALSALALSVLLNGLLATCYYFIARAVGLCYPWSIFAAGFPITQLSLVLAVTPGGLGLVDAGWYGVLRLAEVPHTEALTFVIAQRAYIFVFVLIWTGVSLVLSLRGKRWNRA